ncbi:MAG: HAMP domain-containing sensor histidine kinase [Acidobacteriota bacterium]
MNRASSRRDGLPLRRARAQRRGLLLAFAGALVPLLILLGLQYRWLSELEKSSRVARESSLGAYLSSISKDISYFYWKEGQSALALPSQAFAAEDPAAKFCRFFSRAERRFSGARPFFVASFGDDPKVSVHDSVAGKMVPAEEGPETDAILAAVIPWHLRSQSGRTFEEVDVELNDSDPRFRTMVKPVIDEESHLVGLVGFVLDQDYLKNKVLPKAVDEIVGELPDLVVTVWDRNGELILGEEQTSKPARSLYDSVSGWKLTIHSRSATPEQWARANFLFNLTLSAVLALVLLAAIAFALRTASRELHLSEMKNDFVSNVSHELRTPLSSIRVFGEFMRLDRVSDPAKVREYGEYIETESRRLTQLIDNILDFSRIESGGKVYHFEECDLVEVVTEALKTFEIRLRQKGFRLYFDGPEEELPPVAVDPGALAQAICNLIDNAVKYSNGAREIQVAVGRTDGHAEIAVTDHGIGISRDQQKRIFDRFHRVSTGLVHDVKGAGLGLSIVQHIVQAHGGKISVRSELGRGSTFTVHLPFTPSAPVEPSAPEEKS